MGLKELEARLTKARKRQWRLLDPGYKTDDWDAEWQETLRERLEAERELALAEGEEVAIPYEWSVPWSTSAPNPHVISSSRRTYLLYTVSEPQPNADGTGSNGAGASSPGPPPIALVEFVDCYAHKFGGPNDEVFHGHPLHGKGLGGYGAYQVANSHWLVEQERINSVRTAHDLDRWGQLRHYLLLFHDEIFECIAKDHKIEVLYDDFRDAIAMTSARLFR